MDQVIFILRMLDLPSRINNLQPLEINYLSVFDLFKTVTYLDFFLEISHYVIVDSFNVKIFFGLTVFFIKDFLKLLSKLYHTLFELAFFLS